MVPIARVYSSILCVLGECPLIRAHVPTSFAGGTASSLGCLSNTVPPQVSLTESWLSKKEQTSLSRRTCVESQLEPAMLGLMTHVNVSSV